MRIIFNVHCCYRPDCFGVLKVNEIVTIEIPFISIDDIMHDFNVF